MKINTFHHEIEYRGLFFPFRSVKKAVVEAANTHAIVSEILQRHCIHKTFNRVTGQIDRKYAIDAVFSDLHEHGWLEDILNNIIQREYLD